MPYITYSKRDVLDGPVDQLRNALRELESDDSDNNMEGNINYAVTSLLLSVYGNINYRAINDVMGVLESIKQEFYRRAAGPYEDQKAFSNGDVYPSEQK